ncbi:hypothetical protein ABZ541_04870 [Micromonospora sediminicola]|uniref:hypothetical protein n=1 Tax=Micromonospora sediminicola TaxID=946078 RepID=UPI0033C4600B
MAQLELAFDVIEEVRAYDPDRAPVAVSVVEGLYMHCITQMRRDLGLSNGGRVDLLAARGEMFDLLFARLIEEAEQDDEPPTPPARDRRSS